MHRYWIYFAAALGAAAPLIAADFQFGELTLRTPEGYVVERLAGPPLVERPIAIARDERGRLYVTDSAGMTERADKQLAVKPHRIRRLEDADGDGVYDHSTLFAEGVMFPEGCLWHAGSLYVAAPPEIWKFTDDNDDGRSDRREVWYDGKTLGGCGNDLHGPYLGLDGRFYWCKGAFAEQRHELAGGRKLVSRAGHIFRARPDGTEREIVLTGGMDNPVNVAFSSTGERFLSCTFFQFPEAGRRDGLIHAIYGGVYGKRHDSIFEHPQTGDVMPVLHHAGAAAPCGLTAGSRDLFGGGYRDDLFACYFNLHAVFHHKLVSDGATFRTVDQELLACDHPDFHPTDVQEDADGSLLVVDTGGWYKICCPTSQLAKPDVLGAIYCVRKVGQPAVIDPLGLKLDWDKPSTAELVERLGDRRLYVRRRATDLLRKRPDAAAALELKLNALHDPRSPRHGQLRLDIVWCLAGIDNEVARKLVRAQLSFPDPAVQQAAAHVAGLWKDAAARTALEELLTAANDDVSRSAAEAIGRIGDAKSLPALFAALGQLPTSEPDESGAPASVSQRVREHSLLYALIEIGDASAITSGLDSKSPTVQRAALVALDQLQTKAFSESPGDFLKPEQVLPLLHHPTPMLRNTAAWIASHRPQWGDPLADYFRSALKLQPQTEADQSRLLALVSKLARAAPIQNLLADELTAPEVGRQLFALRAMTSAGLPLTPPRWLDAASKLLPEARGELLDRALAAARQWPLPKGGHAGLQNSLLAVAENNSLAAALRLEALAAAGPLPAVKAELLGFLLASLAPESPQADRSAAASALGSAALSPLQRESMLQALAKIGPLELPRILPALAQGDAAFGRKLLAELPRSAGYRGLRADQVQTLFAKYPAAIQAESAALLAELNAEAAQEAERLAELLRDLPPGDVSRGHAVFWGKKANCIQCHTLGYAGGRLGPDLTNIGRVRNERDLLEAIVFPSASLVRGYEPVSLLLADGRSLTGVITRENRTELVLALDAQKTQTIPRDEIAEMQPSPISLMPKGLAGVLSKQELADLTAFLKAGAR